VQRTAKHDHESRYALAVARPVTSPRHDPATAHLARLAAESAPSGVSRRQAQGAHYTPPPMVDHLVSETLDAWRPARADWRAIDPACGSGNFLVALARELAHRFREPIERVVATRVFGVDVDPRAVELAREALVALATDGSGASAEIREAIERNIVVADALAEPFAFSGEFDLILGNPPFLNQLERGTALARERARAIAAATNGAVTRYADVAAAFLVTNLARLAPDGRLGFVMPQSFLSTGDSRRARDAALDHAELRAIWSSAESHFEDASVRVATLVFSRARLGRAPRRAWGCGFAPMADAAAPPLRGDQSWSPLLADAFGAPVVTLREAGSIGDIAHATADFRDQYYGLAGAIATRDALGADDPILVTTRHIDLARNAWGERPVRILGARYERPVVERAALARDPAMQRWLEARGVPKILVATQTKVIEAWVDAQGTALPLVPLVTVTPRDGADLWEIAAAVASPVVAARALALYAGSALSASAIKLSAKQLLAMPTPVDRDAWRASAAAFREASGAIDDDARRAALARFAEISCDAHGLAPDERRDVLAFWRARSD